MTTFDPEALSPADHDKWHRFLDGITALTNEVFDVEIDKPAVVVGVQFGDMGGEEDLPNVLVSANLPICLVLDALEDMLDFAHAQHKAFHDNGGDEDRVTVPIDAENVPDSILDKIREMYPDIDLSQIKFMQVTDINDLTADLQAEPETEEPQRP